MGQNGVAALRDAKDPQRLRSLLLVLVRRLLLVQLALDDHEGDRISPLVQLRRRGSLYAELHVCADLEKVALIVARRLGVS